MTTKCVITKCCMLELQDKVRFGYPVVLLYIRLENCVHKKHASREDLSGYL